MVGSVRMPIIPDPPPWGRPLFLEILLFPCCVCFTLSFIVGRCWRVWGRDINTYHLEEIFRSLGQGLGSRNPRSFSRWHLCVHLAVSIPHNLGPHRRGLYA